MDELGLVRTALGAVHLREVTAPARPQPVDRERGLDGVQQRHVLHASLCLKGRRRSDYSLSFISFDDQKEAYLLSGGSGVNSGHKTFNKTELVINDLGQGSEAVGSAAGIGNLAYMRIRTCISLLIFNATHNFVVWVVLVEVYTANVHGRVGRRRGDDNLLGTAL